MIDDQVDLFFDCPHCGRSLPGGSGTDAVDARRSHSLAERAIYDSVDVLGRAAGGANANWVDRVEKDGLPENPS